MALSLLLFVLVLLNVKTISGNKIMVTVVISHRVLSINGSVIFKWNSKHLTQGPITREILGLLSMIPPLVPEEGVKGQI